MKKKKVLKIILCFVIIMVIIISVIIGCSFMTKEEIKEPTNTVEVVDKIDSFGYQLEDRDTEIYKQKYEELKTILSQEQIDEKSYASVLAELFLIDLYTLDNKLSKYDIGSLDFIYASEVEKFKKKLLDTLYKLVEDNSNHGRKQELPVVKSVTIKKIEETKYKKGDVNLPGYKVSATIEYEKNLGYDQNVNLTLVKEESKMYVVNLSTVG